MVRSIGVLGSIRSRPRPCSCPWSGPGSLLPRELPTIPRAGRPLPFFGQGRGREDPGRETSDSSDEEIRARPPRGWDRNRDKKTIRKREDQMRKMVLLASMVALAAMMLAAAPASAQTFFDC